MSIRRHVPGFLAMLMILAPIVSRAGQVRIGDRTFTLPDGFTIEQVAGPPLVNRPVTADLDEQGRLYVTDASGTGDNLQKQLRDKPHRVMRLEDTNRDGRFDRSTLFADQMMFPEGTLWYHGSLYVAGVPSIWKLTNANGKGIATERSEWFQGKTLTGCGNDLHGPYLGLDGWIYWCKGAFAEQTYERPGHKPFVTRAAHLFRARPDGTGIEPVMTGGMDNPVEIVFTPGGERIFTCTFLQNPAGGKRDGIIHAIYGGIYGKIHDVIDDHPHTSPDVMPVLVHLGPAAACALVRYESEVFGKDYRDNLFASEFNLHKVTRHVLTPDGATLSTKDSDFLVCDSLDFHPTHLIEDADGSLLVIDTGGWYKLCCPTSQIGKPDVLGTIYRVRRVDAPKVEDGRGLKLAWDSMSTEELAKLLGDPRPLVRKRAIQALAEKGDAALEMIQQVLATSQSAEARVNAIWAATRIESDNARRTVRVGLKDADETVRQAAAHSASAWRDRGAFESLVALLGNASATNRRVAAEALGRLADARCVPAILTQLAKTNDRVLDHSLTYALIEIDDAKATTAGLDNDNPRVRRAAMIALDQMEDGGVDPRRVAKELTASDAGLRETAAWIAGRHPDWGQALAGVLRERIASPDLSADERGQLEHQLSRLAKSPEIQRLLADLLQDPHAPAAQKHAALAAIAGSGLKELPASWADALANVLQSKEAKMTEGAVEAVWKVPPAKEQAEPLEQRLMAVAENDQFPPEVRLDALAAMRRIPSTSAQLFHFLTGQLAANQPANQRLVAAQVLGHANLTDQQLVALTDSVKTAGPLEIDRLLAAFEKTSDSVVGMKLVEALGASKMLTSLRPDALKPRLAKFGADVQKAAEPLLARLNPNAEQQKQKLEHLLATLPSGDVRRGQILFNGPKAACSTCHAIGYVGGTVGPDLTRVGSVRSERDLLESVVFPSASFVQSFEPVMVITNSGDRQYGIPRRNDAQELVLVAGPNQEIRIDKKDVKEIRPGTVSVMPEGLNQQLSPQELGDLLAFLKACR